VQQVASANKSNATRNFKVRSRDFRAIYHFVAHAVCYTVNVNKFSNIVAKGLIETKAKQCHPFDKTSASVP
jgi:hypothetical protein